MRAAEIFQRFIKGDKNIFSPNIVTYDHSESNRDYIYELSWGDSMFHGYVAGVTVVNIFHGHDHGLSQCFVGDNKSEVIREALAYANGLGGQAK
jgi:hypothetical protein